MSVPKTRTSSISLLNLEKIRAATKPLGPTPEQLQDLIEKARKDWEMQAIIDRGKALDAIMVLSEADFLAVISVAASARMAKSNTKDPK